MKWYKGSESSDGNGRDIIACYIANSELTFYRRIGISANDCSYWAYADEVDLQKDIIDNLHDSTKTVIPQYTGKRLISI